VGKFYQILEEFKTSIFRESNLRKWNMAPICDGFTFQEMAMGMLRNYLHLF